MNRRRLMLAIGAALLVGGAGTAYYGVLQRTSGYTTSRPLFRSGGGRTSTRHAGDPVDPYFFIGGLVGMALGAGLIGFAVLRPTNRKDE